MGKIYKGSTLIMESGAGITVDDELSTTSENPVQNKVITEALNEGLVLHSATEPATPEDGMLWYDETNKVLKIYSEDDAEWKTLGEGGVTSINGNTGDITMSTGKITLTQNGEEAGHFFLDQTIDKTIDLKGVDKTWQTKSITGGALEISLRTICYPSGNFTLTKPADLIDGEEYVVRFINGSTPFNMTLGHGFTNPFGVDLTLSADAKDQFTFMAIEGILELQPAPVLVAPTENPQAPTGLEATVSGTTGTIKWTDPLDAGTNIWLNTKLVRKAGSEPTSLSDGTVVVTVTTRNQYQATGYDDTGLTAGTTYYYRAFAEFDEGEILGSASANITPSGPTPPTPPTPGAYTYSQIIDDAYATNGWGHIMSAELNTAPDVYFASLQASGNLSQQGSVYYISHDPTSITGNDVISGYEIFYNPSYQQWIMQMRDMTYDQIVHQATIQGTFNGLLPTLKTNASTYYTNLTNSGNLVEIQNPGSAFYLCSDSTDPTSVTEIGGEKVYYSPELGDWSISANYGYWTYDQIIARATADGNFYWCMMEMNRSPNGYLIDLNNAGHIYQVGDNYWLSADGTSAYNLNGTVLRYQGTFDEWSIGAA